MKFDDQLVEQIRNSINIVDLVGSYLRLKKKGQNYSALCPFHPEKTPSFVVSDSKQIFKCFGCGAGGDIFKFMMMMESHSFPDAVDLLAQRCGLSVQQSDKQKSSQILLREQKQKAMEFASKCYRHFLDQSQMAQNYLRGRKITSKTAELFQIGYAPEGGRLFAILKKEGFSEDVLLTCGLIKEGKGGRRYEQLRQRIVFPILDLRGRVIAFGGRLMSNGVPKYLNSPETELYNKGAHLYALDLSRSEIRRRGFAILVEGYFDCIVPHQFGFRNVVASLGTSLTNDQVRLLRHYTRRVVMNYDPDSAGMNATLRGVDIFVREGFDVSIAQIPGGQDPDSYLRDYGAQAYGDVLRSSAPFLDFLLSWLIRQQEDPYSPKGKREITEQILPHLTGIPNRIERAEYVSKVAALLKIDENLILAEMRRFRQRQSRPLPTTTTTRLETVTPAEKTLLLAALDPVHTAQVFSYVDNNWFDGLGSGKIFEAFFDLRLQKKELTVVATLERLQPEDQHLLETLAVASESLSEEVIQNCAQALRRKYFEKLSQKIQQEILEAEKNGTSFETLQELLGKKVQIRKNIDCDFV